MEVNAAREVPLGIVCKNRSQMLSLEGHLLLSCLDWSISLTF